MGGLNGALGRAALALGAFMILAAPAATQRPARLSALARLEPGLWQLRDLDHGNAVLQNICLGNPDRLIQLRHRDAPCSRLVIANDSKGATVHYTCPAGGYGRTSVTVETPRLARIDTQGIADNAPFAFRAQARRVGACKG